MGDVISFQPRARPPADRLAPTQQLDVRANLEEAVQAALDTADRLIAVLDGMDGDTDREDGGDAEPSLGAPEGHASQVVWLRGADNDREGETPESVLPGVVADLSVIPPAPLPWGGRGNIVAAAGVALLEMVAGGGC